MEDFWGVNKLEVFVNIKMFSENSYSSHCCFHPSTMAFSELIQHAGNFGRFQIILVISTFSLIILLSTDNLVENFSAAISAHRCYVHLLDNITSKSKLSRNLSTEALLRISIPMNANNKQEQCRQFRQTQWQLLNSSDLTINSTELEMEPCLDGWTYDQSIFTSTIVTKV